MLARPHARLRPIAASALLACVLAGCGGTPAPAREVVPLVDDVCVTTSRWMGTALGGPRDRTPASGAPAWTVTLELFALERPLEGGQPLAAAVRLGADVQGSTPLGAVNPLLTRGRAATGADAQRWERELRGVSPVTGAVRRLARTTEPLLAGGALSLSVGDVAVEAVGGDFLREYAERGPFPRRVDVVVSLAEDEQLELLVALMDRDRSRVDADGEGPPRRSDVGPRLATPPAALRRDVAVLESPPAAGGAPVVVLVPSPFATGRARWYAAVARVDDRAPPPAAVAIAEARFARAAAAAAAVAESPDEVRLVERNALDAIRLDDGRRSALLFLADRRNAPLAAQLALTADAALLAAYAARIERLELRPGPDLGWRLERAALRQCAALLAEDALSNAMRAVLLHRAGQAGTFAGILEEVALGSRDLAAAEARLVEENRLFLEDSDPSARVRAVDWLADRGLAPEGFDPLADRETRRAVLRALRREAEARDTASARKMEAAR